MTSLSGVYGTFPYIPLLEGHAGKVYLTNNPSLALQFHTGRVGNTASPTVALNNGVLAFSPNSDAAYQGRLTIGYNGVSTRTELQYNGANWAPTMSDDFLLIPVLRDISYISPTNQYDMHQFTPWHPNPDDLDVFGQRSGGSDYRVFVWALGVPEIASVSPSVIPADGQSHVITISLKRRLHSSQTPSVTATLSAGTVTLGNALPLKNADGQITGWTITAIANNQPNVSANLHLTISETITYLKVDTIVTESVEYLNANVGTVAIQSVAVAAPITIQTASLGPGVGADPIVGYLTGGTFMGGLTFRTNVTNGNNWFGTVTVVAKPTGTNNRIDVIAATTDGPVFTTLDGQGNTLYQQNYIINFDTITALRAYPKWDIGYVVQTETGMINNWFGSFVNGNLTTNIPAYTIYAKFGTDTYQGSDKGTFSWDTSPTSPLKGLIHLYISENWNTAAQNVALVPSYIEYQIDGGGTLSTVLTGSVPIVNQITGNTDMAREFATIDTTGWTNGNHTITWTMKRTYPDSFSQQQPQSGSITFATNQAGAGGVVPTFAVSSYGAIPAPYDKHYNTAINWTLKATSINQFTGTVAFSVTGLPTGSTAVFTPASGSLLSGDILPTTLTVNAPTAVVGSYPLTVHASSGGDDQTCNITLEVINTGTSGGGGGGGGCVPAGTILFTADGWMMIEDATVGQPVLAYDEVTLAPVEATVSSVLVYEDRELYNVETHDGNLICSHDHRLTLKSSTGSIAYVPARDLIAGDDIVTHDGTEPRVSRIFRVGPTGETARVHHVTLSGGHVFVAGGFLAHNMKAQTPSEL